MNFRTKSLILIRIPSVLLFILLFSFHVHASKDWPGFRGPNSNGTVTDGKFAPTSGGELALNWRATIGPGYSGVSVLGNQAVTLFSDGTNDVMVSFDLNSGKELWRSSMASTHKGHDGSHDGPIATPAIANGKVFAFLPDGNLAAVDLASGKQLWKIDVLENGGKKPFYGYASSPIVAQGVVVVEIGGESGKAVAGFDTQTGKLKWTAGNDAVDYQSPLVLQSGAEQMVLAVGNKKLIAIDPANGKQVLEYEHGGDDAASIMVPVLLDENRVLLRNKEASSDLIRITKATDGKLNVEKVWTKDVFKNSYCVPVYYKGYLYGFNGRVLTAVDAANGETKWRSRDVSDGWVLLVDGHLIIQTKTGSLHMGPASPDGWNETAHLDLFQDISWTPPSFADGTIFSRSQKEIARLKWQGGSAKTASNAPSAEIPSTSQFGKFLAELQTAQDKKGTMDRYLESQKTFPIIEWPDNVIFVYNGPADDVAISGDLQGSQREEPMHRIPGTDVFYFNTQLEPDARINYRYVKNFDQMIADPKNPNATTDRRGNPLSWVGMPAWKEPSHLKQAPADKQGRVEKQELPSKIREGGSTKFEVYLPHDYDRNQDRYPVVYIFDGASALTEGKVTNTLDNVIGNSVQPLIAVFLTEIKTGPQPQEQQVDETKATTELLVKEVVPFVDAHYRTNPDAESRALMGPLFNGYNALFSALQHPEMFGGVATQSIWLDTRTESSLKEMIRTAEEQPLRLYLDWGLYDAHSTVEGWDVKRDNRLFDEYLRSHGYRPAGGETHDSYGWASWRNRTDLWLASLFPSNGQK